MVSSYANCRRLLRTRRGPVWRSAPEQTLFNDFCWPRAANDDKAVLNPVEIGAEKPTFNVGNDRPMLRRALHVSLTVY